MSHDHDPSSAARGTPKIGPKGGRRRILYAGVATAAALGGASVAWWKFQPHATAADAALWGLTFDTPSGEKLTMQSLRGKPLLVNFWATWCAPCVEEMPLLDRFYRENSGKSWQVLGLAIDQVEPVNRFLKKAPVSYPVGMAGLQGTDLGRSLGNSVGGLPFTVVFGAAGTVLHRKIGQLTAADLQQWAALG